VLERLETTCSVIAPALVGHAGSKAAAEITSFDQEVDRIAALVGKRAVHMIGYSLGARIGLGLLVRHGPLFRSAILISGHPGLVSERERQERVRSDARWCELLEREGIEAFANAWEAEPMWESQKRLAPETLAAQRRVRTSHSAEGLAHCLRATGLGVMPNFRPVLPHIRVPVTLMAGGRDVKFRDLAGEMARLFPRAELRLAPDAGHNLLLERPDLVTQSLSEGPEP
jgi:2-succinyl-6-hydroxy-2,4-cyclohexadiene-1-carboxylate synthase